jgi:hypothetical protein
LTTIGKVLLGHYLKEGPLCSLIRLPHRFDGTIQGRVNLYLEQNSLASVARAASLRGLMARVFVSAHGC